MKLHELAPSPGSNRPSAASEEVPAERVARPPAGDKGAEGAQQHQARLRRRSASADPADPEAARLREPVPGRVQRRQPRRPGSAGLDEVTPQSLEAGGIVQHKGLVKILGRGELHKAVAVSAHGFSRSAVAAIEAAGGSVTVVPPPYGDRRPPAKGNALANR